MPLRQHVLRRVRGASAPWTPLAAFAVLAALLVAGCSVGPAGASGRGPVDISDYPSGPIEVVVPYAPGGATDQMSRSLAEPVARALGSEPIVVLNQPGGSGTVGTTRVVSANPDGYTLGFVTNSPLTIQPHYGRTIYDHDDPTPVARVAVAPLILAVRADAPWHTVEDLVAAVRTQPGSIRYASTGAGNPAHLAMEGLDRAAGVETVQVPFESSAEAVTAVLGGNVEAAVGLPSAFLPSVRAGDLRIIANLGSAKGPGFEDVPTLRELGYDAATDVTTGFIGPPGMPEPLVDEIAAAVRVALDDPVMQEKIEMAGAVPAFGTPQEYADDIATGYTDTEEVLRAAGLL